MTRKTRQEMEPVIRQVIHEWDPYALLACGAPEDEFDSEIRSVVALIDRIWSPQDAARVLSTVFSSAFQRSGFTPEDCEDAGEKLFKALEGQGLTIRNLRDRDRGWVRATLIDHWGSADIVTRGVLHRADTLPGFVAVADGEPRGLVTVRISGEDCEIVTLDSLSQRVGIGTALIKAVENMARTRGCLRVWLVTTNDNLAAQEFYLRRGFARVAVHKGAIGESRKLKPEIPETGLDGIPISDEIEMTMEL